MNRYTRVRSKNHSCEGLRQRGGGIGPFPVRSVLRLGSTTHTEQIFPKSYGKYPIIEINTVESIQNSRSKLRMKECFKEAGVKQAVWMDLEEIRRAGQLDELRYPVLIKRVFGFKGKGMQKLDSSKELDNWLINHNNTEGWYLEEFFNGSREYRLHITEDGCFMAWRKLRKEDTPQDKRWYFNSDHCNWVGETHELFNRPNNWDKMVKECVKALKAVGLDVGSIDLRCQGSTKDNPDFIIVEINSAPSLGERGLEIYRKEITKLIQKRI